MNGSLPFGHSVLKPCLIVACGALLAIQAIRPTFQHDGMEFIFMLEGEVTYRHNAELFANEAWRQLVF